MATLIQDAAYHCRHFIRCCGYEAAPGIHLSMDDHGSQVVAVYSMDGSVYATTCVGDTETIEDNLELRMS